MYFCDNKKSLKYKFSFKRDVLQVTRKAINNLFRMNFSFFKKFLFYNELYLSFILLITIQQE